MAEFIKSVITDKGHELISSANEKGILFTKLVAGCGEYEENEIENLGAAEQLKNSKQEVGFTYKENKGKQLMLQTYINNEQLEEGYTVREIGIYARENDENSKELLFAIAVAEEETADRMPRYNGIAPATIEEEFYFNIESANKCNIILQNRAFVTVEQFVKHEKKDITISGINIQDTDWTSSENGFIYIYRIDGITGEDLAIVWFRDTEIATDAEVKAETVAGGIRFSAVNAVGINCSIEVKKVK